MATPNAASESAQSPREWKRTDAGTIKIPGKRCKRSGLGGRVCVPYNVSVDIVIASRWAPVECKLVVFAVRCTVGMRILKKRGKGGGFLWFPVGALSMRLGWCAAGVLHCFEFSLGIQKSSSLGCRDSLLVNGRGVCMSHAMCTIPITCGGKWR